MSAAQFLPPLPPINSQLVDQDGRMTIAWQKYMPFLDQILRQGLLGPFTNAANDAAAAAAGVPINGFYRNGSVVQIRVT